MMVNAVNSEQQHHLQHKTVTDKKLCLMPTQKPTDSQLNKKRLRTLLAWEKWKTEPG